MRQNGFTLPLVLIALSGILFLTTGAMLVSRSARLSTRVSQQSFYLDLALDSAQESALSLLSNATNRDSFITHQVSSPTGDALYYVISWFDPDRSQWMHQPLFSGAEQQAHSLTPGTLDRYIPLSDSFPSDELSPHSLLSMRSLGFTKNHTFNAPQLVLQDDESQTVSYSFWVEDLNGLLDYEAMTYHSSELAHSYESSVYQPNGSIPLLSQEEATQRLEMKIRDQRHLGITAWCDSEIKNFEYPIDFSNPFGRRLENSNFMNLAPPPPSHPFSHLIQDQIQAPIASFALSSSVIKARLYELGADLRPDFQCYMTQGLPDTFQLEIVPYGHNYSNAGIALKQNLNTFISRAESSTEERAQVVLDLASVIKSIPGFKDNDAEYQASGISPDAERSHTRYGGFPIEEESYTQTLAANILDYADKDSAPTSVREAGPKSYRGIDAMPLLSLMARRYGKTETLTQNGEVTGNVIEIRTFLEIWNPTNLVIQGYLKYEFLPGASQHIVSQGLQYPLPAETLYYWKGPLTLQPNEYKVIEVTTDNDRDFIGEKGTEGFVAYEIPANVPLSQLERSPRPFGDKFDNRCKLYWSATASPPSSESDFKMVCGFLTPFNVEEGTIRYLQNENGRKLYANYTAVGIPLHPEMKGDARNNLYCRKDNGHLALNFRKNFTASGPNYYQTYTKGGRVNPQAQFPDGAYNSTFSSSETSNFYSAIGLDPPGSDNGVNSEYIPTEFGYLHINDTSEHSFTGQYITPTGASLSSAYASDMTQTSGFRNGATYPTSLAQNADCYLQKISNRGFFTSLGELGFIYDPAQWRSPKRQYTHNHDSTPDDLSDEEDFSPLLVSNYDDYGQTLSALKRKNGNPSLSELGGGITLAVGSPEFNAFDPYADPHYRSSIGGGREGYESARLLDQLRVTQSELRSLKSKINLNTAPRPVLKALFSGFTHNSDRLVGTFTQQPRTLPDEVASALTEGIIYTRGLRPFRSLSDIALTRTLIDGKEVYLFGEKAAFVKNITNTNALKVNQTVWNDGGREELFRRSCDLFTTLSRTYRLYIQAEFQSGKTKRVRTKTMLVSIHPHYSTQALSGTDYAVDRTRKPEMKIHFDSAR